MYEMLPQYPHPPQVKLRHENIIIVSSLLFVLPCRFYPVHLNGPWARPHGILPFQYKNFSFGKLSGDDEKAW
jgi:hypothetical protein